MFYYSIRYWFAGNDLIGSTQREWISNTLNRIIRCLLEPQFLSSSIFEGRNSQLLIIFFIFFFFFFFFYFLPLPARVSHSHSQPSTDRQRDRCLLIRFINTIINYDNMRYSRYNSLCSATKFHFAIELKRRKSSSAANYKALRFSSALRRCNYFLLQLFFSCWARVFSSNQTYVIRSLTNP